MFLCVELVCAFVYGCNRKWLITMSNTITFNGIHKVVLFVQVLHVLYGKCLDRKKSYVHQPKINKEREARVKDKIK